jgi:outer membrane protein assembly factor BamB
MILIQKGLAVGIVLLFLGSSIVTMMVPAEQQEPCNRSPYDCYHRSNALPSPLPVYVADKTYDTPVTREASQMSDDGLMNSSWPMYCHDVRHTGQSQYITINNLGTEKWRFQVQRNFDVDGSPVIAKDGTIYFGTIDFYALYPNGTLKWRYASFQDGFVWSAPAISNDGTIYVGLVYNAANSADFYAFNPNGTVKWIYSAGGADIFSSPVIGNDGTIYFGDGHNYINALYPNGTLRWRYYTGDVVYSSPAIRNDGTVYCGSHDKGLYALYPNNGTLKWRFATGGWIRTSPCIAEDGTIYCVSLDNYLYAVNPNGTMKWRTNIGAGTSPTIGQDGTIYAGWDHLYAISPINGSVRWVFNPGNGRTIEGATPAHSADGTIYFGTHINDYNGGEIIAVNLNGTERWRKQIADCTVDSAPAIDEDGSVYIGSGNLNGPCYLYAFGSLDPNAPTAPTITGHINGKIRKTYTYTFTSSSPLGNDIYYTVDWGDGTTTDWLGPYASGETLMLNHSWRNKGTYLIQARAKDTGNLWGPWGTLSVTMPCSYDMPFMNFLERALDRFQNAFPLLRFLMHLD